MVYKSITIIFLLVISSTAKADQSKWPVYCLNMHKYHDRDVGKFLMLVANSNLFELDYLSYSTQSKQKELLEKEKHGKIEVLGVSWNPNKAITPKVRLKVNQFLVEIPTKFINRTGIRTNPLIEEADLHLLVRHMHVGFPEKSKNFQQKQKKKYEIYLKYLLNGQKDYRIAFSSNNDQQLRDSSLYNFNNDTIKLFKSYDNPRPFKQIPHQDVNFFGLFPKVEFEGTKMNRDFIHSLLFRECKKSKSSSHDFPTLKLLDHYIGEENGTASLPEFSSKRVKYFTKSERENFVGNIRGGLIYKGKKKYTSQYRDSFVLSKDKVLYISYFDEIKKFDYLGKVVEGQKMVFTHSSFIGRQDILMAGTIFVFEGQIQYIDNSSGHYYPPIEATNRFVRFLDEKGVDISQIACQDHSVMPDPIFFRSEHPSLM